MPTFEQHILPGIKRPVGRPKKARAFSRKKIAERHRERIFKEGKKRVEFILSEEAKGYLDFMCEIDGKNRNEIIESLINVKIIYP